MKVMLSRGRVELVVTRVIVKLGSSTWLLCAIESLQGLPPSYLRERKIHPFP
jgi:hypothetical protein